VLLSLSRATLASDGVMMRPRLVERIDNVRTGARRALEPQLVRRIALKPENVGVVKRAMAGAHRGGHRGGAFLGAPYTSGGKTGTAQVIAMKQNEKYVESKVAERFR